MISWLIIIKDVTEKPDIDSTEPVWATRSRSACKLPAVMSVN